jgi:hypothetical protein
MIAGTGRYLNRTRAVQERLAIEVKTGQTPNGEVKWKKAGEMTSGLTHR